MKRGVAIKLKRVSKRYTLHHEKPTFVETFFDSKKKEFYALKDVSLKIMKGEKVGIIGPNGAGKTTLLKIIAGITNPTEGKVEVNGKIVSLLGLEAGFHSDLTGIENIFLNGMLLGMSKSKIKQKLKKIIDYADIGEFIDTPLYTYSSGMKLRLSFSVALHADPDIFIFDEGYNVGDQKFKNKIRNETNLLFNKEKTIIIASHTLYTFFDYCERIIVFDKGAPVYDGGLEAVTFYDKDFNYNYMPPAAKKIFTNKKS